jgi:hypothetical protein
MKALLNAMQGFEGYNPDKKKAFERAGRKYCNQIKKAFPQWQTKVSYNKAGIACSGDFHIRLERKPIGIDIFFNADSCCDFVTYRYYRHMNDWCGGPNHNITFEQFCDFPKICSIIEVFDRILRSKEKTIMGGKKCYSG